MSENDIGSIEFDPKQEGILRFPGDFVIGEIKLYPWNGAKPVDLTNLRLTVNIYEDIFNNFLTGSISLVDAWDFTMLYPLIGEEVLEISFKRPETKDATGQEPVPGSGKQEQEVPESRTFSRKFRVIKLTNRSKLRDRAQYYELHFCSPEMIANKKQKVRRHFEDQLYSDMAGFIYKKYLFDGKPIEIEKSKYIQDFTISCWTPAQAINIIASRAIPASHYGSNYVFYETLKHFHFISIEELMTRDPRERLVYMWKDVWTDYARPINIEQRSVDGYNFVDYFDVMSNLQHGMYKSVLYTYDLVRQQYKKSKFKYLESFKDMVHLEENPLCTPGLDAYDESYFSRVGLVSTNKKHDVLPWIAGKEPGINPTKIEKWLLKRQSQFQQLNNVRLTITVPGNPNRQAGDIIEFMMPNSLGVPTELDNKPELYLSGRYIITAIRHRIELKGYGQDIEIVKDSYLQPPEYIDPVPIYVDKW